MDSLKLYSRRRICHSLIYKGLLFSFCLGAYASAFALDHVLLSGNYTSTAASTELPQLCTTHTKSYPKQWTWDPAKTVSQARAATATDLLTPKIEQVRNGKVIAVYSSFGSKSTCNPNLQVNGSANPQPAATSGCGSFGNVSHVDLYRLWENGDTFLVYPAVYSGQENNIFIGPRQSHYQAAYDVPSNITIQGVTVNGIKPIILDALPAGDFASGQGPVYIYGGSSSPTTQNANNIVIENLDVAIDKNIASTGKAGVYVNGATNLTLRQMRVYGFEMTMGNVYGANGIFTTPNNTGTLTLDRIELYHNGGGLGPAHNIYVDASATDPNFTVRMTNSWTHNAFYGHTFKSRAPNNVLLGNFFQGGTSQGGIYNSGESYLVDIPNGGKLTMANNVLLKDASGHNTNGASITFAVEGVSDARAQSVNIQNNTFVAFASSYDGAHPNFPFFFWHSLVPGAANFQIPAYPSGYQVPDVTVTDNAFVGYCTQTTSAYQFANYRGELSATMAFSELKHNYAFTSPAISNNLGLAGTIAYEHETQAGFVRKLITYNKVKYSTIGAED